VIYIYMMCTQVFREVVAQALIFSSTSPFSVINNYKNIIFNL